MMNIIITPKFLKNIKNIKPIHNGKFSPIPQQFSVHFQTPLIEKTFTFRNFSQHNYSNAYYNRLNNDRNSMYNFFVDKFTSVNKGQFNFSPSNFNFKQLNKQNK